MDNEYNIQFDGGFPFQLGKSKLRYVDIAIEQAIVSMEQKTTIKEQRKVRKHSKNSNNNSKRHIHYDGSNGLPLVHSNHGAVLVNRSGSVLAKGFNHVGECTFKNKSLQKIMQPYEYTIHAEMDVIRKFVSSNYRKTEEQILKELSEASLYVVRVSRSTTNENTLVCKMSTPCETCARNLEEFNIRRVYSS